MNTPVRRVALVTGADRGIGLETCRQLLAAGMQVILTSRNPQKGMRARKSLLKADGLLHYWPLDVTDEASIIATRQFVESDFKRLDVLINNADVCPDQGVRLLDLEEFLLRQAMETNFYGPYRLIRAIVPLMERHGYGRIVNVSAGYGPLSTMGGMAGAYKISKVALSALTRVTAGEVDGRLIKINAVDPGRVPAGLGGRQGPLAVKKAAGSLLWLATLPEEGPTAGLFYGQEPKPW